MQLIKKILKDDKFLILALLIIVTANYSQLLKGFFEQDEWFSFGWFILHKNESLFEWIKLCFAPSVGHYNPFTNMLQNFLFSVWGMDYTKFISVGISLHLVVTTLVYYLSKIIFKSSKLLSFFAAAIFGVFASSYQGVGWAVAGMSILCASIFGLISTLLFFKFLEIKEKRYLLWSLVFLIVSLFFKEITIGLFPLYFLILLLKGNFKKNLNYLYWVVGFGIFYVGSRISMVFVPRDIISGPVAVEAQSLRDIIYNLLTIPVKSISQLLMPTSFTKSISVSIGKLFANYLYLIPGSPEFESFVVRVVMEAISIFFGSVIIIFSVLSIIKSKMMLSVVFEKPIIFGLGWVILNSVIFSYAPETSGTVLAIDSRNLYLLAVGMSLFIVGIVHSISKSKIWLFLLIIIPTLNFNIYWLNVSLNNYSQAGIIRKGILNKVTANYPRLPKKVVFYTQSDTPYYGLPDGENILPFQSGFGQTLMVWYSQSQTLPAQFFEDRFLWEIDSQGYKEFDGYGFGYFRNLDLLRETVRKYNLPMDSIISFNWDSKLNTLNDISLEVSKSVSSKK